MKNVLKLLKQRISIKFLGKLKEYMLQTCKKRFTGFVEKNSSAEHMFPVHLMMPRSKGRHHK